MNLFAVKVLQSKNRAFNNKIGKTGPALDLKSKQIVKERLFKKRESKNDEKVQKKIGSGKQRRCHFLTNDPQFV